MFEEVRVFVQELWSTRNVLIKLVEQQLLLRYRRSALGFLWTLINPLAMMSFMAVVFSVLFKVDLKVFAVFLFSGMIAWSFFSTVVSQSGTSFYINEGLIKKIYLPKAIFPLTIATSALIDSLLSFSALLLIILYLGGVFSWALLFLPISFLLLFIFSLGIGLTISVATVFFRDLQHILAIAIQALFFLTPVLYKHEALAGGKIGWLVAFNPVTPFIALFRTPLTEGVLPSVSNVGSAIALATISIGLGLIIFIRQEHKIVFRL